MTPLGDPRGVFDLLITVFIQEYCDYTGKLQLCRRTMFIQKIALAMKTRASICGEAAFRCRSFPLYLIHQVSYLRFSMVSSPYVF